MKEYLKYYLGQECVPNNPKMFGSQIGVFIMEGYDLAPMHPTARILNYYPNEKESECTHSSSFWLAADEFKLCLRKLESMTDEERKQLWTVVFGTNWAITKGVFSGVTRFIEDKKKGNRWVLMQGVERLGIEWNGNVWADSDLSNWSHNQHAVTHYLLSLGFDLFGLIDKNLAIEKGIAAPRST